MSGPHVNERERRPVVRAAGLENSSSNSAGFVSQRPPAGNPPQMRLIGFKPLVKGALRGFANLKLPNGLTVADCPVCVSHGKAWASLPSKPVLDRKGRHVEVYGKRQYATILSWGDRQTAARWSEAVVALVRGAHPDALEGLQ